MIHTEKQANSMTSQNTDQTTIPAQYQDKCRKCGLPYNSSTEYRYSLPPHSMSAGMSIQALECHHREFFYRLCPKCAGDAKRAAHFNHLQELGFIRVDLGSLGPSDPELEAGNRLAWNLAKTWDRSQNLWFYGPVGTGKSFSARHILKEVAGSTFQDVGETNMRSLPAAYTRFDKGNGIIDRWKEAKVLLIDDIDKATWNESAIMALFDLLEDRHPDTRAAERQTIVTSNVALPVLYERLQKISESNSSYVRGIFDRLNPCQSIELKGASHRPKRETLT